MPEQNATPPSIVAAEYRVARRAEGQWQLDILWRFENEAGVELYVLLDQPLVTHIDDPLVLNHTSSEPPIPVEANQRADFEIVAVPAGGSLERWLRYSIALPETSAEITVVGRFGYSHSPPDAEWVKRQNRTRVAGWQQVADSAALSLTLPE